MQLSQEIITAPATAIKTDGDHLFWTSVPSDSLTASITSLGQTVPVLAQETENDLELITGHARITVLRSLNRPAMVRLVQEADALEKGLLYLADNAQAVLDDGMRLAALRYFRPLMDEKTLRSDILPRLGVKPKSKDAKLFAAWLDLDDSWHELLQAGHIPLATGTILTRMNEADRSAVKPLFETFSWSRSNAVNILTWLFESAKMQATTIADVMENSGATGILKEGLSPKDAIARLTAAARAVRYPELQKLQETFAATARDITAGTRWRMNQPNNFETGGSELSIQIKNTAQLEQAVNDLAAMAKLPSWGTLWKLGGSND